MTRRAVAMIVGMLLVATGIVSAGGIYLGTPFYALDLAAAYDRVPVAIADVGAVLTEMLEGMGIPPTELAAILAGFADAIETAEQTLEPLPDVVPLPLIGGGIEIGLPLVVIDGIRFSGGLLNDRMVRGVAEWAGAPIPEPFLDVEFDAAEMGFDGTASVDVAFSSWMASTEVVKRLDLLLLGMTLSGGLDVVRGQVVPQVDIDVPAAYRAAVDDALAALRLDEIAWSAFAAHVGIGFEIGLRFLRIYGDVRYLLPLSRGESWWAAQVGGFAGLVGFAILF